jgi:hypothetical protein
VAPLLCFYLNFQQLPSRRIPEIKQQMKKYQTGKYIEGEVNCCKQKQCKLGMEMILQVSPVLLHLFSCKTSCFPVKKQVHCEPGSSAAVQVTVKMRGDWRFSVAWSKMSRSMNSIILIQ